MQDTDKIYGLIAQAEDIQAHAIRLQHESEGLQTIAQNTLQKLPEAFKAAVRESAKEIFDSEVKNVSKGLLRASERAEDSISALAGIWLKSSLILVALALVIAGAGWGATSWLIRRRLAQLTELDRQISQDSAIKAGFELVSYNDGTQGIILPKGTAYVRSGQAQDGRTAVVIKP